jgi:hypothetical protein
MKGWTPPIYVIVYTGSLSALPSRTSLGINLAIGEEIKSVYARRITKENYSEFGTRITTNSTIFSLFRFDPIPGHGLPLRGFTITLTGHTTLGRTPLDEWSARSKYLQLKTRNTHKRQSYHQRDSNPQSQQTSGRRATPQPARPVGPALTANYGVKISWKINNRITHFRSCKISWDARIFLSGPITEEDCLPLLVEGSGSGTALTAGDL